MNRGWYIYRLAYYEFVCNPNVNEGQSMKSEFSIDDQNSLTKKTYSAINMYLLYDD